MAAKDIKADADASIVKMDGWKNILTGLGIAGRDKRMSADFQYTRMTKVDQEHLYGCDDMAEKVVDYLAEEMQRAGFEITHSLDDEQINDKLDDKFKALEGPTKFDEALKWARLYGGAGIIMGIQDGNEPDKPVNFNNIRGIDFLNTMHKWELQPQSESIQRDPTKPSFGLPMLYQLSPEQGGAEGTIYVHADRILRFDGARLPRNLFIQNSYWHDSVLNRFKNPLRNFQTAHDGAATLMHDFAQAVYKIKHLTEMISQGRDDLVQKRLELVDVCRSIVNAIVLEEGEEFERKTTTLTGMPELLGKIEQRLVQASKMPHTILLGESPSGLGATGESEKKDWFEYVGRQQEVNFKPQLMKFFRYCFLDKSGPTRGKEPETWDIEFNPLWQMDQKKQAEVNKLNAETDKMYIETGVVDPDEVARSRFGTNDGEIQIDLTLRGEVDTSKEDENARVDDLEKLKREVKADAMLTIEQAKNLDVTKIPMTRLGIKNAKEGLKRVKDDERESMQKAILLAEKIKKGFVNVDTLQKMASLPEGKGTLLLLHGGKEGIDFAIDALEKLKQVEQ